MAPAKFAPANPANGQLQTHALDSTATGIGNSKQFEKLVPYIYIYINLLSFELQMLLKSHIMHNI